MAQVAPLPIFLRQPVQRPVDPDWKCQQSGECCTQPAEVVMTRPERMELLRHMPEGSRIVTEWRDVDEKFVALKAHPCPFFIFKGCVVYQHRPYQCRRFACMRPDPKTEPLELGGGGSGCYNMMDRYQTSRVARRLLTRIQQKAQRWAVSHGWTDEKPAADAPAPTVSGSLVGSGEAPRRS